MQTNISMEWAQGKSVSNGTIQVVPARDLGTVFKLEDTQLKSGNPLPLRPVVASCLEGRQKATALVDTATQSFAIRHGDGFNFLGGTPSLHLVEELLAGLGVPPQATRAVLVPLTPDWTTLLKDSFQPCLTEGRRLSFESPSEQYQKLTAAQLPMGLLLSPLTSNLANMNTDFPLLRQMEAAWGDIDSLCHLGWGCAVVSHAQPERILSLATTFAIGAGEVELSVATRPEERRHGYSRLACDTLMRWCVSHSLTPCWSCLTSNTASLKTAISLGFKPHLEYVIFDKKQGAA